MEKPLHFDIQDDELELFLQDVNEHLQTMETNILHLEQAHSEEIDQDTLNAAFRAAHTLKAVAATVGHRQMADLTHTLETLFDAMREGHLLSTPDVVDELLSTIDILKALRDEVTSAQPSGVDITAIVNKLNELVGSSAAPPSSLPPTSAAKEMEPTGVTSVQARRPQQALTVQQAALAQEYEQSDHLILEVQATASSAAFAPGARLLQVAMAAEELGEVIVQHPPLDDLANEQHDGSLWLILATPVNQAHVKTLLSDISELSQLEVHPVVPETDVPSSRELPELEKPSATALTSREAGQPARQEKSPSAVPSETPLKQAEETVRISVERLNTLMNLVGELVTNRTRLIQIENTLRTHYGKGGNVTILNDISTELGRVVDQLQQEVMQARMLPIENLFVKFPRLVRDIARTRNKQVDLVIQGETTELDRSIIEVIGDPLIHLLRNAVDHGIESPGERLAAGKPATGTIWLTAAHEEGHIVVTVRDDGRGIDRLETRQAAIRRGIMSEEEAARLDDDAALSLIFHPNLSTARQVTDVSGRGMGMDIVQTNVKRLGGMVMVDSQVGHGTTFRVTLPLTLAILQTMLVALGNDVYAIPLTSIIDSLYLKDVNVNTVRGSPVIQWRGQALPLLDLRRFFAHPRMGELPPDEARRAVITVTWGKLHIGLVVDRLIGQQEIVIKSLSPIIGNVAGLTGCTILGDGRVALIVDVAGLINAATARTLRTGGPSHNRVPVQ
ncbi:MAG: chemotaxis protein CheA [Anaerolineae bacterium]|nr:chemotaxis protein CheA [Anaerolineae bacterium]